MGGTMSLGLVALAVGLAPVPAAPAPDPLAWGYLGVRVEDGTLVVRGVEAGTPAEKAGLRPEDELVKVGTLQPQTFQDVVEHISGFRPGSQLRVEVRRAGEVKAFTVRLGARPADLPAPRSLRNPLPEDP